MTFTVETVLTERPPLISWVYYTAVWGVESIPFLLTPKPDRTTGQQSCHTSGGEVSWLWHAPGVAMRLCFGLTHGAAGQRYDTTWDCESWTIRPWVAADVLLIRLQLLSARSRVLCPNARLPLCLVTSHRRWIHGLHNLWGTRVSSASTPNYVSDVPSISEPLLRSRAKRLRQISLSVRISAQNR